ncbi:MAG TPA: type II toxin-antitoxin system RelE/ParE family toxin [Gemmataceae bacterium]|nr:type II toxin-antitoxin system RelE/ParE family toxin [Gemmataceae bacterium]
MSQPRITDQAHKDMNELWDYLAPRNLASAEKLLDDILDKARLHAQFPLMGRSRQELAANLRSFVVRPYVIFYRPVDDTIDVLRVLHGSRDIDTLMQDME